MCVTLSPRWKMANSSSRLGLHSCPFRDEEVFLFGVLQPQTPRGSDWLSFLPAMPQGWGREGSRGGGGGGSAQSPWCGRVRGGRRQGGHNSARTQLGLAASRAQVESGPCAHSPGRESQAETQSSGPSRSGDEGQRGGPRPHPRRAARAQECVFLVNRECGPPSGVSCQPSPTEGSPPIYQ